eukprot:gnl/TRDRNA2_/TRDRNA2_174757_c1_seq8.p2 gnl/TRDRNA2_/TRDRNA2_174757_c1~~gnl/TRDRNA2_/TRDRNA2_174757_c1_seq8.p2  ORF type:complete len:128 (+),score=10.59 gnl/TRDRNA2_/TRDRNA2_174757_c1_seq8:75-458(+)
MAIRVTSVAILALLLAAMVACAQPASCIFKNGMCDEHGDDETAYLRVQVGKDQPGKPDKGHEKPEKPMAADTPVQAHYNATDKERPSPNCGPTLYCQPGVSVCCPYGDVKSGACCQPVARGCAPCGT